MANKRSNKKNRSRKNQSRRMRGGSDFNVPIRAFYPQNTFAQDPSREMTTSIMKGGKKNHSRKYLKKRIAGGDSFFNNVGSINGSQSAGNQITGTTQSSNVGQSYRV